MAAAIWMRCMFPEVMEEGAWIDWWKGIQRAFIIVVALFFDFGGRWHCEGTFVNAGLISTAVDSKAYEVDVARPIEESIEAFAAKTLIFFTNLL